MKKVFGVMILAGLPVACVTTLPSTPEATPLDDAAQSVTAQGGDRSVQLVPVDDETCAATDTQDVVRSIKLLVAERGKGWVRVSTQVETSVDPRTVPPCFLISWSTSPDGVRHVLTPSDSTQDATLSAAPGARVTIRAVVAKRRGSVAGERAFVVQ